ncbi:phosphoenolpyruvate--protein phosphotransferase [uncultured Sphaerochaeta sp.]|uniref:phosphoenolpyruvate--protein phosphotransferase n=1 Tax=uncultured Sphaerochaeta sp. TaxID=886478 RepID=UPI002A0A5B54|nr:phosphoenolpyruvate--protein phosphotransferase [uncultured Sphaerochaeta sp.]
MNRKMKRLVGKVAVKGIAIGRIVFHIPCVYRVNRQVIVDEEAELIRYIKARKQANKELQQLYEAAIIRTGEKDASIFQIHQMMVEDADFCESVENMIRKNHVNAEFAVQTTGDRLAKTFSAMDDEYMKARSADVNDVSRRLIALLSHVKDSSSILKEPAILVAEDLSPSETMQIEPSMLLGFATRLGSHSSHTAILARNMGIPALTGIAVDPSWDGRMCILDGYEGVLYIDPDDEMLLQMHERQNKDLEQLTLLESVRGEQTITKSGVSIKLFANIGNAKDAVSALSNDAEGIGLFRSEFLFLNATDYPSEESQFQAYREVAEKMKGRKVIIRTLDIGSDKQAGYFHIDPEDNPALGFRAIRICLSDITLFKTQLRAILRASAFGNLSIMYPMITSVQEVREARALVKESKEELKKEGIAFGEVPEGIMVETPAAALISDQLAREVDFFSLGTNDLTQYTLALDRENEKLERFYDPYHPAVLALIRMTIANGHKEGIEVGLCGELGSDPLMVESLVRMGIDELSVAPPAILQVRSLIRAMV